VVTDFSPASKITLRTPEDVADVISASVLPARASSDRLGLEIEGFPVDVSSGVPAGRIRLREGAPSVLDVVDGIARRSSIVVPRGTGEPRHEVTGGGAITYEPGAQIEYSSPPGLSLEAVAGLSGLVWQELSDAFWEHKICLVNLGIDPWSRVEDVPQQLSAPRYRSMADYLSARGPHGAVMMRNTSSFQVNLEQGSQSQRDRRWLVANLISPLLTAMFATSPGRGWRSRRARAWQRLDPTRTGFPQWSRADNADLISDTVAASSRADVIYFTRDGVATTGRPGWSFGGWVNDGHPGVGQPTAGDLETHLTTLFTEVRARRGTLELRGIDSLPQRWWMVPATVAGAVVYDDKAADETIELLEGWAPHLHKLWLASAREGLTFPELGNAAEALATIAEAAARRHPGLFGETAVEVTTDFLSRFTMRRRSPADELSELADRPRAVIEWAVPQHASVNAA